MEHLKIQEKDVYIVKSHNRVLEAWEKVPPCNVFTLDYHTDTKTAFSTYAYWRADSEAKAGKCGAVKARKKELIREKLQGYRDNELTLKTVNLNLRHDEHIDFSVRTGIADKVFVVAHHRNEGSSNPKVYQPHGDSDYKDEPIVEFSPGREPNLSDRVLSKAVAEAEALEEGFFDNFILDIDCDYFTSRSSLHPENRKVFDRLVEKAEIITIAREPECVKICRREGSTITSDIIKDRLVEMIGEALTA